MPWSTNRVWRRTQPADNSMPPTAHRTAVDAGRSPNLKWFRLRLGFCLSLLGLLVGMMHAGAAVLGAIDFNRDIRPIFSENCYACHGPDKNKRKAGLRFDQEEGAFVKLEGGDFAIVRGDPQKSKLLKLVVSEDSDERMPPPKTGKRLSK